MNIFRRSAPKTDENAEVDGRASLAPEDQPTKQAEEEPITPSNIFVKGLDDLQEVVSAVGDYRKRLDREGEAVSNFVQDLNEHVEQVSSRRSKLEEDARKLSELCEKLEQETAEVSSLRSQIAERVSRIQELLDQHRFE